VVICVASSGDGLVWQTRRLPVVQTRMRSTEYSVENDRDRKNRLSSSNYYDYRRRNDGIHDFDEDMLVVPRVGAVEQDAPQQYFSTPAERQKKQDDSDSPS